MSMLRASAASPASSSTEGRGNMASGWQLMWAPILTAAILLHLAVFCGCAASQAAQIQVGGSAGWTLPNIGNINYTTWAAAETFVVGDNLYFNYSKEYHNVMEVKKADYETCNGDDPITTYDDGETLITLDRSGTFYFLCGVPSHCTVGQKVAVKVRKHALSSSSSSIASSPQSTISPSPIFGFSPTSAPLDATMNDTSNTSPQHSFRGILALASPILFYVPQLFLFL